MRYRVIVLGIDGATPQLIDKWIDELPNFQRLQQLGVYAKLESTIPFLSSPAWNCLFTGKNPAKIGIFDFLIYDPKTKKLKVADIRDQKSLSIWDIGSMYGKKVCVLNVPTLYPPYEINGIMVSGGLFFKYERGHYAYPRYVENVLDKVAGGYEILPPVRLIERGHEAEYLSHFLRVIKKRIKVFKFFLENFVWDLFIGVIFVTDSVQHYFWHYMDEEHPLYVPNSKYKNVIKHIYKIVDGFIGYLIDRHLDNSTYLFVVSDHGFCPYVGDFMVNNLLEKLGLLYTKENSLNNYMTENILGFIMDTLIRNVSSRIDYQKILNYIPKQILSLIKLRGRMKREGQKLLEIIDWEKTLIYGFYPSTGAIYINKHKVKSVEEQQQVIELIKKVLLSLKGPDNERLVDQVFLKEEIYNGPYTSRAPDIVYIMRGGRFSQKIAIDRTKGIFDKPALSGAHSRYGIFYSIGPNIHRGKNLGVVSIYDITPTILYLLNLPIPNDVDGNIVKNMFIKELPWKPRYVEGAVIEHEFKKYKIRSKIKKHLKKKKQ